MPTFVNMTGPGTAVVTDDAAVAITLQTELLTAAIITAVNDLKGIPGTGSASPGTLGDIANKLDAINGNLSLLARESKAMSAAIGKVETATASTASAARKSAAIQSVAAMDQIMTNEFQKQVTKDGLTRAGIKLPVLPDFLKIAEEKIKDGFNFNTMIKAQGMITQALDDTAEELQDYFKLMADKFGITKYVQDTIESFKVKIPNPELEVKKLQADTIVTTYQDA
jgi:hypothetical protein